MVKSHNPEVAEPILWCWWKPWLMLGQDHHTRSGKGRSSVARASQANILILSTLLAAVQGQEQRAIERNIRH